MPVATSIVMDVVSFAWSRAVSLSEGALSLIGLAIVGHPENDGHPLVWQEAVGHEIIPASCANEATCSS
jgi:hypothetical protein